MHYGRARTRGRLGDGRAARWTLVDDNIVDGTDTLQRRNSFHAITDILPSISRNTRSFISNGSRFNNGVYHDWRTMEINARGLLQAKLHPLAVSASIIFSWRTTAIFGFGWWPTFATSPIPRRRRCIVVGQWQQKPIIRIVSNTNLVAFAFTRQWSERIEHFPTFDVL